MITSKQLISIIIPVYNSEEYLRDCLESIKNQSYKNIEVLLINDGSTDKSELICKDYCERNSNFFLYSKPNGGTSDAKNLGVLKARGEWILFIDSDDSVDIDYVKEFVNCINKKPVDLVVSGYRIDYIYENYSVYAQPEESKKYKAKQIKEAVFDLDKNGLLNVAVSKMYRRELLIKNEIKFDKELTTGEDLVFNCDYFKCIRSVDIISGTRYYYKRRDVESLVNKFRKNLFDQVMRANTSRLDLYKYLDMSEEKYQKVYRKTFIEYISATIPNLYRYNSGSTPRQKKQYFKKLLDDTQIRNCIYNSYDKLDPLTELFVKLYKINSVKLFVIVYDILFFIRNNNKIYNRIRKKIFTRA